MYKHYCTATVLSTVGWPKFTIKEGGRSRNETIKVAEEEEEEFHLNRGRYFLLPLIFFFSFWGSFNLK